MADCSWANTAAVQHHQKYFGGQDDGSPATSGGMGSAAAMQALKMFTGGSGGGNQSQFIGMAMSEASKVRTPSHYAAAFPPRALESV